MKSPLFLRLKSLKFGLENFSQAINYFSKALGDLETRLEPRSSKFSRIENQGFLRIKLQGTVNLSLTGTVHM